MKKIVGILIGVALVFGLAFGVRQVMSNHSTPVATQKSQSASKKSASQKQPTSTKSAKKSSDKSKQTASQSKKQAAKQGQKHHQARKNKPSSKATTHSTTTSHQAAKGHSGTKPTNRSTAASKKSTPTSTRSARQSTAKKNTPAKKRTAEKKRVVVARKSDQHHTTVYLKVSGYKKTFYAGKMPITKKSTAFSVLKATHLKLVYTSTPDIYVSSINGLRENDVRPGSGWMYSVNHKFVDKSAGLKRLKKGETVHWYFSVDGYKEWSLMKKAMFVGAIGCGKTTLIQRMGDMHIRYNKTQAIEFYDNIIDTPGEYVEHRELYSGLRTTSTGAKLVVLMQSAVDPRIVLPAGFSTMFTQESIGVVTKIDLATQQQIDLVKKRLLEAGVKKVFTVSAIKGTNVKEFMDYLKQY